MPRLGQTPSLLNRFPILGTDFRFPIYLILRCGLQHPTDASQKLQLPGVAHLLIRNSVMLKHLTGKGGSEFATTP